MAQNGKYIGLNLDNMGGEVPYIDYDALVKSTDVDDMDLFQRMKIAIKFDFNQSNEPGAITFERKFMLNCGNQLGEQILPQTCHILMTEFRRFMALNANIILMKERDPDNRNWSYELHRSPNKTYGIKNDEMMFFESALVPCYEIDLVWRQLILETEVYIKFCHKLGGGFIDREHPLSNIALYESLSNDTVRYEDDYLRMTHQQGFLNQYHTLYYLSYHKYDIKVTRQCLDTLNMVIDDVTQNQVKNRVGNYLTDRNNPGQYGYSDFKIDVAKLATDLLILNNNLKHFKVENHSEYYSEEVKISANQQDALEFYENIISCEFDQSLLTLFKTTFNFDDKSTMRIMIEYGKFITLVKFADRGLCPGFWVDEMWHLHMQSTKHYRDFGLARFEKMPGHKPSSLTKAVNEETIENFKYTLQLYKHIFGIEAPSDVWTAPDFGNPKSKFININLFLNIHQRGVMHSQYKYDPSILESLRESSRQTLVNSLEKLKIPSSKKKLKRSKFRVDRIEHYLNDTILTDTWRKNYIVTKDDVAKSSADEPKAKDLRNGYGPDSGKFSINDELTISCKGGLVFYLFAYYYQSTNHFFENILGSKFDDLYDNEQNIQPSLDDVADFVAQIIKK